MKRSGDLSWVVLLLVFAAFGSSYQHLKELPLAIDGFNQTASLPGADDTAGTPSPTINDPRSLPGYHDPDMVEFTTLYVPDEDQFWVREDKPSCLNPGERPVSDDELAISSYLQLIATTRMGAAVLQDLEGFNTAICFDRDYDLADAGGIYSQLYRAIIFRADATVLQRVQIIAHELRHAWQDQRKFLRSGMTIEDELTLTLAIEADADAFAMAVMWELHASRGPNAWPAAQREILDPEIAVAFTLEMRNLASNPTAYDYYLRNAMRAAYLAWFRDTENDEFYVARMAARYRSRPMIGSRRLADVLPNIVDLGRFPGQLDADRTSYLDMFEISQAYRRAAEHMPQFQNRVNGTHVAQVRKSGQSGLRFY